MILISLKSRKLTDQLAKYVEDNGLSVRKVDPASDDFLVSLYEEDYSAIITEGELPSIPRAAQKDLLSTLASKIPVVLIDERSREELSSDKHAFSSAITVVNSNQPEEIISTLDSIVRGPNNLRSRISTIPVYNSQIAINMIKQFGGLGILTIDASSFIKISTNYGSAVYQQMQAILEEILFELWGTEGCFRKNDVIVRKASSQNEFLSIPRSL